MANCIYTIGHSTHSARKLVELLAAHDISVVADIRSQPYSRMNPQFNREVLQADLKFASMSYLFLGRELGARSDDAGCYIDGQVQYDLLARTELFQEGLARIENDIARHRIAMMCAEKDPLTCHRAILVCRHLAARGIPARHILEDGRIESHEDAVVRLLAELDVPEQDLFLSREDLIANAYSQRGLQIAYREKEPIHSEVTEEVRR